MTDAARIEFVNFKVLTVGEFMAKDEPYRESAENAYRRGYSQGYAAAVADIKQMIDGGYSRPKEIFSTLHDFCFDILYRWRNDRTQHLPPTFHGFGWYSVRKMVFDRDGRVCSACGSTRNLQIDHVHPVSDFGTADMSNLRVLCRDCNNARNTGEQ